MNQENLNKLNESVYFIESLTSRNETWPVTLTLKFAILNGKQVCFYSSPSTCVDWGMIEDWLTANCPKFLKNHCDSSNFHNCLSVIR